MPTCDGNPDGSQSTRRGSLYSGRLDSGRLDGIGWRYAFHLVVRDERWDAENGRSEIAAGDPAGVCADGASTVHCRVSAAVQLDAGTAWHGYKDSEGFLHDPGGRGVMPIPDAALMADPTTVPVGPIAGAGGRDKASVDQTAIMRRRAGAGSGILSGCRAMLSSLAVVGQSRGEQDFRFVCWDFFLSGLGRCCERKTCRH